MPEYDLEPLRRLGERRAALRVELDQVNRLIDDEIAKATAAGRIQADLARASGLTRESVAQKVLPKSERWRRGAAHT
jgi:hypothetical protein